MKPGTRETVNENAAMGDKRTVVENYYPTPPVESPGWPPPTKRAEVPKRSSEAERDERWSKQGIVNVSRIDGDWSTIDQPGVISGQVTESRINRFDNDRWTVVDN
jgi:hypothetical protein